MPKENMRKIHDKTNIIRTESDSVSGAIRHHRPDTATRLIGKPVIKHSHGKNATRLLKTDKTGIEITSLSRRTARRKRITVPVCDTSSLANNECRKLNKNSGNICAECSSTSARNQSGEIEPLQHCTGNCGVSLHPSCLAMKCGPLTTLLPRGYQWFCQDCRTCSTIPSCSVTDRMTYLLKCDTCKRGYHLQCLQPAVSIDKPKSTLRCLFCRDHAISSKVEPFDERGNRQSLKIKISISNFHNRENRNTVSRNCSMKNESTNELDTGEKLNSCKDVVKKQKIGLGNWMVPLDLMPNSYDKTDIDQTIANSLSSQHHRQDTASLNRIPVLQHSSGRKAQLLTVDSDAIETTPLSLPIAGKKRKTVLAEASDKKNKKKRLGKPSISDWMYFRDVMVDGNVTSAPSQKKIGKPSISGSMYLRDVKKDCNVPFSLLRVAAKKRKRALTEVTDQKLKKEKLEKPSIVGSTYQRDVTEDVLKNMSSPVATIGAVNDNVEIRNGTKSWANNSQIVKAPVRCPPQIQFGKFEVETSYSCSFPQEEEDAAKKLMFCEYCLKYTKCQSILERHMRHCCWRQPPGIEIYQSGRDFSVFEVDGNVNKTYCQTLCRIGKLFLELKTLVYDVDLFLFYIITKNDGFGCHLVGYFSKFKNNEENYNVSCIVTMPQYRRQGYGRILIELSYLLSKIERQPGTPEKPLSDLGQLTYNEYWKSVILEYLDAHRDSDNIRIDDIISETSLIRQDITNTLESLNMIVEVFKKITICIDWDIVDAHIKKKTTSKQIHIEPNRLRWTPPTKSTNLLFSPDGKISQNFEEPLLIKCIL